MAKTLNFESKVQEVKRKLLERCDLYGCGKKGLVFYLTKGRRNLIVKPATQIVHDGVVFNLRYSEHFNSPFEEDQDKSDVVLRSVHIQDGRIEVSSRQRALGMYLLLHPLCGANGFFYLEDKTSEEERNMERMNLKGEAFEKIKTAELEQLQACYHLVTKGDPSGLETRSMKSDLFIRADRNPEEVLDAFNDDKTLVKYKLFNAIKLGIIEINRFKTELSWKGGQSIVAVNPGENVFDAFASLCLSPSGCETLDILNKKLSK